MNLQSKERIVALTDGIFAVSMTLLVLDLRVPESVDGGTLSLWQHLLSLAPRIDDYVISFLLLCAFWLSHHRLMAQLRGVDPVFLWLNLAFVLFTTFIPATTALVGRYPYQHGSGLIYGINVLLVLGSEILMWRRGTRRLHAGDAEEARAAWLDSRRRFLFAFGITICAIVVAWIEIRAGIGVAYSSYLYLALLGIIVSGRRAPL